MRVEDISRAEAPEDLSARRVECEGGVDVVVLGDKEGGHVAAGVALKRQAGREGGRKGGREGGREGKVGGMVGGGGREGGKTYIGSVQQNRHAVDRELERSLDCGGREGGREGSSGEVIVEGRREGGREGGREGETHQARRPMTRKSGIRRCG